ncbi:MAG: Sporulation stage protein [Clostridia bacterium]|jgi:stage III sporulation protein AF|nr:Sporulation stage protein [Clostridia bacterium]
MKEYMQTFIWIMLFVIVVEMIFPDSEYKKYLKLVLGCIIIYTLIRPAVSFIPVQGKTYDTYVTEYQNKLAQGIGYQEAETKYEDQIQKQQALLKDTYREGIKQILEKEMNISVKQVNIEWVNKEMHTEIEKIYLVIGDEEGNGQEKISVPRIRIGEKSSSVDGDEEKLKIKIKTCLKNFYNVDGRNIYITVQKN